MVTTKVLIQLKIRRRQKCYTKLLSNNLSTGAAQTPNTAFLGREESTGRIFLHGRGMSKFLTGRGTLLFSFLSKKNPGKLPSNNLSNDAKEID